MSIIYSIPFQQQKKKYKWLQHLAGRHETLWGEESRREGREGEKQE
jgi:hypothetical protein